VKVLSGHVPGIQFGSRLGSVVLKTVLRTALPPIDT
jgi:hypothetical protein